MIRANDAMQRHGDKAGNEATAWRKPLNSHAATYFPHRTGHPGASIAGACSGEAGPQKPARFCVAAEPHLRFPPKYSDLKKSWKPKISGALLKPRDLVALRDAVVG